MGSGGARRALRSAFLAPASHGPRMGLAWRGQTAKGRLTNVRGAALAAIGAAGVCGALAVGACGILAGYEDLRFAPGEAAAEGATRLPALDLGSATIYSVYPSIFSSAGNLAAVTTALPRIHDLGFNVLSLMPVTPVGQATDTHVTYQSPYCVSDYYAINPAYGAASDLDALIAAAHQLGMYVILDEEINETSWDNALITAHPEYYVHSDLNPYNAGSIEDAFQLADVAQLDYSSSGTQAYITAMLEYWLATYPLDGFRFLTSDVPQSDPTIPATFWRGLRTALEGVNPRVVMWADEEDASLANAPFELDYGWLLRGGQPGQDGGLPGLQEVATGASATELQQAWQEQTTGYTGVLHTTILQTWDFGEDIEVYGGVPSTMAAATFNFTINGVPMLWNGEEVGNDESGADTHALIDWDGPNAPAFTALYKSLLALRNGSTALQQGAVAWVASVTSVTSTAPDHLASYTRSDATGTFLVLINFSNGPLSGTVESPPSANGWTDVSPAGSPGGVAHVSPPDVSLAPYDFAVFRSN